MSRFRIATAVAVLVMSSLLYAAGPADGGRYVVTLDGAHTLEGGQALAAELTGQYGGTVVSATGDTVTLQLTPSRARLVAADPRVTSVVPLAPAATAAPAPQEAVNWASGISYSYDAQGNVRQIGGDAFAYDHANRLVKAEINGTVRTYEYDAYGNRTKCTQNPNTPRVGDCQAGFTIRSSDNRIQEATYDPSGRGNVTRLGASSYSYDAVDMMTRAVSYEGTREFVYTAADERLAVYSVNTASWRWTIRDTSGKVLRELTSRDGATVGAANFAWTRDYVWRNRELLATVHPAGAMNVTYHYHLDHLGSPRRITDDADNIVGFHDYLAFGPEVSGGLTEPSATPLKYTGHERDATADPNATLDYMRARYYSPAIGRFLSVDPVLNVKRTLREPQAWNRYSYVGNNPLKYIDPTGRVAELPSNCADAKRTCQELTDLRNSVPPVARMYVQATTTNDGRVVLNADLLNAGRNSTASDNFLALRQVANSPAVVQFSSTARSFVINYEGRQIEIKFSPLTPQLSFYGQTLTVADSPSGVRQVFINPFMNDRDRAGTTGHELFGHMRRYLLGLPYDHEPVWDTQRNAFVDQSPAADAIRRAEAEAYANATRP